MTQDKSQDAAEAGLVRVERHGRVAHILFDRPRARNAMTWQMYEGLATACDELSADAGVGVVVMRGIGGKAFVAGTDIEQFSAFSSGDDGVAYEAKVEVYIDKVERIPQPTIAVVEGWAVGGGMALANACDFRIATPGARFGVPIARTLGNCLSARNLKRLTATLGVPMVKRMLLLADLMPAEDLLPLGYLLSITPPEDLDDQVSELCDRLLGHAPVTMRVTKEALRRIGDAPEVEDTDLIHACFGSGDFARGVAAFVAKQTPDWQGS